jgi:hypothetical protein
MSVDIGAETIISVAMLIWSLWKLRIAAPGSFSNVSAKALSLYGLLKEVEEKLPDRPLSSS